MSQRVVAFDYAKRRPGPHGRALDAPFIYALVACNRGEGKLNPITLTVRGRLDGDCYAAIWFRRTATGHVGTVTGSASGGGYHKPSAAFQDALTNAGFELAEPIGGAGDAAMDRALLALAAWAGYPNCEILRVE